MNENEIREELTRIIDEDSQNIDEILKLSNKLVALDNNNVRFSVDETVIDRLGTELVARHETAVSELIKNSYNADAKKVTLMFKNSDSIGGTLHIEDDGLGMTKEQLINGFMRISSTSKIHEPVSPIFKRKRAGKKGIGRFSTQRLGNKLTIITQTENSDFALKVVVDWEKYKMDGDLIFVTNQIEEISKTKEEGTTLKIEGLREWWSEAMIKRVYRYAIDIIQPFPLAEIETEDNQEIKDPGFEIKCLKDDIEIADQQSMFYKHAVAEIEGHIDENGKAYWEIKNSRIPDTNTDVRQHFSKEDKIEEFKQKYGEASIHVAIKDQYFNMREKVEPVMHIVNIAEEAMKSIGVTPIIKPIRGGTDGSQLSYKGLPCPNIFAGGHNFHVRYEYVPLESTVKDTEVIVKIAALTGEKYQ